MKLLILGGYGVFGGRLAELIQDCPFEVLIAGRSRVKATIFCEDLSGEARFVPAQIDRNQICLLYTSDAADE